MDGAGASGRTIDGIVLDTGRSLTGKLDADDSAVNVDGSEDDGEDGVAGRGA